jgi:hypothetical protein
VLTSRHDIVDYRCTVLFVGQSKNVDLAFGLFFNGLEATQHFFCTVDRRRPRLTAQHDR